MARNRRRSCPGRERARSAQGRDYALPKRLGLPDGRSRRRRHHHGPKPANLATQYTREGRRRRAKARRAGDLCPVALLELLAAAAPARVVAAELVVLAR